MCYYNIFLWFYVRHSICNVAVKLVSLTTSKGKIKFEKETLMY